MNILIVLCVVAVSVAILLGITANNRRVRRGVRTSLLLIPPILLAVDLVLWKLSESRHLIITAMVTQNDQFRIEFMKGEVALEKVQTFELSPYPDPRWFTGSWYRNSGEIGPLRFFSVPPTFLDRLGFQYWSGMEQLFIGSTPYHLTQINLPIWFTVILLFLLSAGSIYLIIRGGRKKPPPSIKNPSTKPVPE